MVAPGQPITEAEIVQAERVFWASIPVGALMRPGATIWIAHGLREALIAVTNAAGVESMPKGPQSIWARMRRW